MNFLRQCVGFYDILMTTTLSSTAQALYFLLLNIDNKIAWKHEFTVANTKLSAILNTDISSLRRAREELISEGIILYKSGKGNQAGSYIIFDFENGSFPVSDNKKTAKKQQSDTLNKLNKNKRNETKLYNGIKKGPLNNYSQEITDFKEIESIILERQRKF